METPSVSIVVLNHNYERYVGEALASAVSQEHGDYRLVEVVVIDDGSTDGSPAIYDQFPGVRVVRKIHEGFGATLTRAVSEAEGDWVALLDADDSFATDKLRTLAPHLVDPCVLLIQHAEFVVDVDGQSFAEGSHPGGATSTLLVRRKPAHDLLPITNELFFHAFFDLGFGVKVEAPLTRYRVHDASMTDRHTPGAFAAYMAEVATSVAYRLGQLATHSPWWATTEQLTELATTYNQYAANFGQDSERQRRKVTT